MISIFLAARRKTQSMSKSNYPVCVVFSRRSIPDLEEIFKEVIGTVPHPFHVEYFKNKETNRAIVILTEEEYSDLWNAGFHDHSKLGVRIFPYELRGNHFPRPYETFSMLVHLPHIFSAKSCEDQLISLLDTCASKGLFPQDSYRISIPLESRVTGNHKGIAYVSFPEGINQDIVVLTKLLLQDSRWEKDPSIRMACFWKKAKPRASADHKRKRKKKILRRPSKTDAQPGPESELPEKEEFVLPEIKPVPPK